MLQPIQLPQPQVCKNNFPDSKILTKLVSTLSQQCSKLIIPAVLKQHPDYFQHISGDGKVGGKGVGILFVLTIQA